MNAHEQKAVTQHEERCEPFSVAEERIPRDGLPYRAECGSNRDPSMGEQVEAKFRDGRSQLTLSCLQAMTPGPLAANG